MKFTREFMQSVLFEEADDAEILVDEITDTGRWSLHHYLVFKFKDKFYSTSYTEGATEQQEEAPWEFEEEVECIEVKPIEKIITVYVTV